MRYLSRVEVRLKPGYLDPEGESTGRALRDLGYRVSRVGVIKVYEIEFSASSLEEARRLTEEMCRRLLSNPVKDDYSFEVRELGKGRR
jgi:phosphoribosylformylglycinamidine synthase